MLAVSPSEASTSPSKPSIRAERVAIRWHPDLPVFAKEEFLGAVGEEYGWLGGIEGPNETPRCILPYTILRRSGLRMIRFRTETITCGPPLSWFEEKTFLDSAVQHFRMAGGDVIVPATNNAIFRTYPDGATAAPYGTFVIDLQQPEEGLWRSIRKITRQNIGTARKDGVQILQGNAFVEEAYDLVRETFRRSHLAFMDFDAFRRYVLGLGENGLLLRADCQGVTHSCCLFGFSDCCAYAIYAGNLPEQHQGAMKLLQWEAIRRFRGLGIRRFDFVGARIDPEPGSKQESINQMKQRFGATLSKGYIWKYALRPGRAWLYSVGVRLARGGDIVDQEKHKLPGYRPTSEGNGEGR